MRKRGRWLGAAVLAALVATGGTAAAGWQDLLRDALDAGGSGGAGTAALTSSEMTGGLKEALAQGVEWAVNELGRPDGFLGNAAVRIPVPDSLQLVEKSARALGQGHYVDEFVTTMNRAAERAVPETATILADTIRKMSVEDAAAIVRGPDDAATRYFERTSGEALRARLLPIVSEATASAGVTAAYKGLVGQGQGMLGGFMGPGALDLDGYVTDRALAGLFTYIAQEERRIRANPAARTTELMRKVFAQ